MRRIKPFESPLHRIFEFCIRPRSAYGSVLDGLRRDEVVNQNSGNLHRFAHQESRGEARLQCSVHSRSLQQRMPGDGSRRDNVAVFVDGDLNVNGTCYARRPSFRRINGLRQTDRLAV